MATNDKNNEVKKTLAFLIETEANKKISVNYLKKFKRMPDEEINAILAHHDICVQLVDLAKKYNFPYTALVYFAVGSDAHKKTVFEKGYRSINTAKAERILKWLKAFAKHNDNPGFYTCEKIVHAFSKFYDTFSQKDTDFRRGMKAFEPLPKETFKPSKFKTMAQFYDLFTKPYVAEIVVDENDNVVEVNKKPVQKPAKAKK